MTAELHRRPIPAARQSLMPTITRPTSTDRGQHVRRRTSTSSTCSARPRAGVGCADLKRPSGLSPRPRRFGARVSLTHVSHGAHFSASNDSEAYAVRAASSRTTSTRLNAHSSSGHAGGLDRDQLADHWSPVPRNNVTVGTRQRRQRAHSITVKPWELTPAGIVGLLALRTAQSTSKFW